MSTDTPILVSDLDCNPTDLTIYSCPRSSASSCNHSQDVALECSSPYPECMQILNVTQIQLTLALKQPLLEYIKGVTGCLAV